MEKSTTLRGEQPGDLKPKRSPELSSRTIWFYLVIYSRRNKFFIAPKDTGKGDGQIYACTMPIQSYIVRTTEYIFTRTITQGDQTN